MKTKKHTTRNPFSIAAKKRKAGKIRPRKDKRQSGKNKQRDILQQAE